MIWTGQSFDEPSLSAEGSLKMGVAHYTGVRPIDPDMILNCLFKGR